MNAVQSNIERIQREIQNLNKKLTDETKKEADRTEKIIRAKQSISRTSSNSIIKSKMGEIQRYEREIGQIQKKKADLSRQIADKTAKLHSYQQQLMKEQEREHKKMLDSLKQQQWQAKRERESVLTDIYRSPKFGKTETALYQSAEYDAFISYAREDRQELVGPLAEKLKAVGFNIWYDDFQLTVGDSLRRSIDKGLANSRFGIVVLSSNFFAKNWPQYELDGLVNRELSEGTKLILPLWHKVSKDEVIKYSPSLADKVALNTANYSFDELVEQLSRVLKPVVT